MPRIDIGDGSFDVDAATIADGFGLDPSIVPALMKAGASGACASAAKARTAAATASPSFTAISAFE